LLHLYSAFITASLLQSLVSHDPNIIIITFMIIIISEHCCAASYFHGNGETFYQDRLMNKSSAEQHLFEIFSNINCIYCHFWSV